MSTKEIKEGIEAGKVYFGVREALKHKNNIKAVFIAKDTRDDTVEKLEKADIEFVVLKSKADLSKNLNLDFMSEVFSIKK